MTPRDFHSYEGGPESGACDAEYGHLRRQESDDGALRLVIPDAA